MKLQSIVLLSMLALSPPLAYAQDSPSPGENYVSREEYDKLKAEHESMKQELEQLKAAVRQMANGTAPATPAEGPSTKAAAKSSSEGKQVVTETTSSDIGALQEEVESLKADVKGLIPGSTKFLLAGYGTGSFIAKSGEDPTFDATFNAFLLWKLTDRLLFEGEVEFEFEDGNTTTNLEIAQASYLLNDYMTIGVGRFLNPMNYFVERQHMGWVNKFPDKPLAVYDGLLPESDLGAQLRGVIPIGPTKLEYAGFVINAPNLITMPDGDFSTLGMLDFGNTANHGGHVAVGGHVGFIPIPQLEIGYGVQRSMVGPRDHAVENLLQSADFNFVADSPMLKGLINFRAQWVWSHIGRFVYDPAGAQGFGPVAFSTNPNGGYVQLAYRPTGFGNVIKNFEPVVRYDRFNQLHTPVGYDEERWSFGLDYWITASAVIKAAYEIDNKNNGARDQDAFMLQVAVGF